MASKSELEEDLSKANRKLDRTERKASELVATVHSTGGALGVGVLDGAIGPLAVIGSKEVEPSTIFALKGLFWPAKDGTAMAAAESAAMTVETYKVGKNIGGKVSEATGLGAAVRERLAKVNA